VEANGYVIAALADPTRRAVFEQLRGGPRPVGEIAAGLPVSRPAVSQHLRVLKEAGLVSERRNGTRRLYRARPERLAELKEFLEELWGVRLQTLKREAEQEERKKHGHSN
jgi:DNA-binding transcriptional ArsR family regulator